MRELSLHIMDIIENGIRAGADQIIIRISEDKKKNLLTISIEDNGSGIPHDMFEKVTDPFFTTKTTRRIGLGLSLFSEASKRCEGEFKIDSKEGKGTVVAATFRMDHIDMAPLGNMAGTMASLIMGYSEVDFIYVHERDGKSFLLDTRQIREDLEGVPINNPKVIGWISKNINEYLKGKN
ncbi:MAG: ATP-binding protein [Deltaproteobacteria bacterium]|nr:ATP-binding protein [Deltaproteobacteria bacterium]